MRIIILLQCFDKCVVEKIGILDADGTFNDGAAIETFSNGNKDKADMVRTNYHES